MTNEYTIIVSRGQRYYVATCVELGVVSQGKTIVEARENIKEAIELYLEDEPEKKMAVFEEPWISKVKVTV